MAHGIHDSSVHEVSFSAVDENDVAQRPGEHPVRTVSLSPVVGQRSDDKRSNETRNSLHRMFLLWLRKTKNHDELWHKMRNHLEALSSEGCAKDAIEATAGDLDMTILHVVCMNDPPTDVVDSLVKLSPGTVRVVNELGMLPLHIACRFRASVDVISLLVSAYPEAKFIDDAAGRVPVHYAVDPYSYLASWKLSAPLQRPNRKFHGVVAAPSVVAQVLSSELVTIKDNNDSSPLDLFSDACKNIPPRKETVRAQAREILGLFLSCKPLGSTVFTAGLQSFPQWLLEDALCHPYVQDILNRKTAQPLFTTFIMLDFGVQLLLTFSFTLVTRHLAEEGYLLTDDVFGIKAARYSGISYLCFRALTKLTGFVKIRRFRLWMRDAWNLVDITNITLLSTTTITMQNRPQDFLEYRNLVTLTGGLQFVALLSLLRTTTISFSVFVTGVITILMNLIPFLITTVVLLSSFAFMYYTLNYDSITCVELKAGDNDSQQEITFCSVKDSFLKVYSMFVGEINPEDFTLTVGSLWLTIAFSFLMVILQLNMLIAVITDSYSHVKRKGEKVFWHHRFYYLADLDTLRRLFGFDALSHCSERYESTSKGWRKFWDGATWELFGDPEHPSLAPDRFEEKIRRGLWRALLLVMIPLWLIGGLITFGWLWPPQVREWLFCQRVESKSEKEPANEDLIELKTKLDNMEQLLQKLLARECEYGKEVQ